MLKTFSMLIVAGAVTVTGARSVQACGGCAVAAAPAPAPTVASAPRAPTATAQNGRQSVRRYSAVPGGSYRAPAMMRGSRSSSGPSWNATRKVLGY